MMVGWIPNLPTVRSKDSKVPPTARPPAPAPSAAPDHATDPHPSRASVERTTKRVWVGAATKSGWGFHQKLGKCLGFFLISTILNDSYEILFLFHEFLFDEKHACSMIYL